MRIGTPAHGVMWNKEKWSLTVDTCRNQKSILRCLRSKLWRIFKPAQWLFVNYFTFHQRSFAIFSSSVINPEWASSSGGYVPPTILWRKFGINCQNNIDIGSSSWLWTRVDCFSARSAVVQWFLLGVAKLHWQIHPVSTVLSLDSTAEVHHTYRRIYRRLWL